MRPIETILAGTTLLAFLSLAIPLPINMQWIRYAAPVVLLIAIVQVLAEGPRWQMLPAYLLTIALFSIWLLGAVLPSGIPANPLVVGAGVVLGVLALIASIALPIVLPVFHFARPTGPYAVGTLTYHWVDAGRPELFTADPNDHRELMAQVWYPARHEPSVPRAPYIQDAMTTAPALARLFGLPPFFFSHLKYVTTNAVSSAPVAGDEPSYPVLVFLSGLHGFRQSNTFQIEELVSHGYIVVGLDQPGAMASVRFPDGRQISGQPRDQVYPLVQQSVEPLPTTPTLSGEAMPKGIIPYFAADVSFALDQLAALNESDPNHILTGRLDLERAGIFGVSLGGINAAQACLMDSRLKACIIMDAFMSADVVNAGLKQPAMWITRDADTMRLERERAGGWTEKEIEQHQTTMRAVYEGLPGDGYYIQIPKMFHLNLTDFPYWSPLLPQLGVIGPIDAQRVFSIVNAYSVAFFDKQLKGKSPSLLSGPAEQYPEVSFETRRP
ncbi:MAG: alpha/beta hydrolase family protein [Chloroflexota bacterium]|jgi:predicted dienelactone hydrolase